MAATPDASGYWLAWSDGNVTVHGDAQSYGNASQFNLNQPIAHVVSTPDGKGYWLVASDGGIFAFRDAAFQGSMGGQILNKPVVGIAAAPATVVTGKWRLWRDPRIRRTLSRKHGSNPPQYAGQWNDTYSQWTGYWFVASDGGIFA